MSPDTADQYPSAVREVEVRSSPLLQATLEALAMRGAPQVVLWTAARNEAAQRLFASRGIKADNDRDDARATP